MGRSMTSALLTKLPAHATPGLWSDFNFDFANKKQTVALQVPDPDEVLDLNVFNEASARISQSPQWYSVPNTNT